ncbi:MAG: hypothetical protein ACK5KP_11105 [Paludibacteraceae bacterium]
MKAGKLTFGQRIALGKIIEKGGNEYLMMKQIIKAMHDVDVKRKDIIRLKPYIVEIIEGLAYWIEKEIELLNYEPTAEEIQAGISELSGKIGNFGTIKSLAKNYSREPDEILKWEYGKVFGILYTDLEEYKFQKRYNKIIESKFKKK